MCGGRSKRRVSDGLDGGDERGSLFFGGSCAAEGEDEAENTAGRDKSSPGPDFLSTSAADAELAELQRQEAQKETLLRQVDTLPPPLPKKGNTFTKRQTTRLQRSKCVSKLRACYVWGSSEECRKRYFIVEELVNTELAYVQHLKNIETHFMYPIQVRTCCEV
jgi:hypothetical protein